MAKMYTTKTPIIFINKFESRYLLLFTDLINYTYFSDLSVLPYRIWVKYFCSVFKWIFWFAPRIFYNILYSLFHIFLTFRTYLVCLSGCLTEIEVCELFYTQPLFLEHVSKVLRITMLRNRKVENPFTSNFFRIFVYNVRRIYHLSLFSFSTSLK